MEPERRSDRFKLLLASVGGVGTLPIMPGTWASLVVIIPALLLPATSDLTMAMSFGLLAVIAVGVSMWTIPAAQAHWGHDPSRVVIDEVAGMALMLADPLALSSPWWTLVAFFVFRVYDVAKPFPINRINDGTTAFSVVADDLLAAVYGLVTLHMLFVMTQFAVLWMAS
ncbi:MAG: phosphatidylglycerophosphatase A [Ignavibacteriae bacterium]|nr:MAG: phosphatidylglycerophosphatase A [Ignavibacteriota bacterium]